MMLFVLWFLNRKPNIKRSLQLKHDATQKTNYQLILLQERKLEELHERLNNVSAALVKLGAKK